LHCPHAGPGGGGLCGANCEGYCSIIVAVCTGADEQYASYEECLTTCSGFDDSEPYDSSDTSGNTLACRLAFTVRATLDPATHCIHAGPAGPICQ
jgi:hypothetical protein